MRPLDRYLVGAELASGGMASVRLALLGGVGGFERTVALKQMHPHLAGDEQFRAMFLDEARIVARIRHPKVVSTLDVFSSEENICIVMDYVHGPSLSAIVQTLRARGDSVPLGVAIAVVIDLLEGLHAAHEATTLEGKPLGIVHRDVSPQNVLVGDDGIARVVDFGIASAADRLQTTRTGEIKGKMAYMAPEQAQGHATDRRADVYSVGCLLFELLTGRPPFRGNNFTAVALKHISERPTRPSILCSQIPAALDEVTLRSLEKGREERWPTAAAMAHALTELGLAVPPRDVSVWLKGAQPSFFEERDRKLVALRALAERRNVDAPPPLGEVTLQEVPAVTDRATPKRRATRLLLGALGLVGIAAASALVATRLSPSEAPLPPGTRGPTPTISGAGTASNTAPSLARSISTPSPGAAIADAGSRARVVHRAASASPLLPSHAGASSSTQSPLVLPDCCDLTLGIRRAFNNCRNNCGPGM